jgi:hypothetical protein
MTAPGGLLQESGDSRLCGGIAPGDQSGLSTRTVTTARPRVALGQTSRT